MLGTLIIVSSFEDGKYTLLLKLSAPASTHKYPKIQSSLALSWKAYP
jgi:hypothetical protein